MIMNDFIVHTTERLGLLFAFRWVGYQNDAGF